MGWLALVFVWFTATILRGKRERFAFGALVAAVGVVGVLNAGNPDDLIVRVNVARAAAGREFDERYALALSADAVPALVEALPDIPDPQRSSVAHRIAARWASPEAPDWRTWNWGRAQAWHVVEENRGRLQALSRRSIMAMNP